MSLIKSLKISSSVGVKMEGKKLINVILFIYFTIYM